MRSRMNGSRCEDTSEGVRSGSSSSSMRRMHGGGGGGEEEEAYREPNGNEAVVQKTPISLLQERCSARGIAPQYNLLAHSGSVHQPLFLFACLAGPFSATGQGTFSAPTPPPPLPCLLFFSISTLDFTF